MSKYRLIFVFFMVTVTWCFLSGQGGAGCGALTDAERVFYGPNITIDNAEVFPSDSGFIFVTYTITDSNADPARIIFRYSTDGTNFIRAEIPEVVNLSDIELPTTVVGTQYLLVFDSREVGIINESVTLELTGIDDTEISGPSVEVGPIAVDNRPWVTVDNVTLLPNGVVQYQITVGDPNLDNVDLKFAFSVDGGEFRDTFNVEGLIEDVPTSRQGIQYVIYFDSGLELVSIGSDLGFQITARDLNQHEDGDAATAPTINITF